MFIASFAVAAWVVRERSYVTTELSTIGPIAYPIAIVLLAIVASAPFSVTDALAVMNGVIFGPVGGTFVNAAGIILAAVAGYYIALRTSRLFDIEAAVARLPSWARHFRVGSLRFLIIVRILPGIGGTVSTQVAAAMRVPLYKHVFAMSVVAIPICSALAIGGDSLATFLNDRITIPVKHYVHTHHMHLPHVHFPHAAHAHAERPVQ